MCLPLWFLDLADRTRAMRTLVHEKIHVLQRAFPEVAEAWVREAGYVRVAERRDLAPEQVRRVRSNPDIDAYVYAREGACATVNLLPDTGSFKLSDAARTCGQRDGLELGLGPSLDAYEHPFERMAYTLSELVVP